MNPIIEATDSGWPAIHSATTLPISASGMFAHDDQGEHGRSVAAVEHDEDQRRATPATAAPMRSVASSCAWNVPSRLVE